MRIELARPDPHPAPGHADLPAHVRRCRLDSHHCARATVHDRRCPLLGSHRHQDPARPAPPPPDGVPAGRAPVPAPVVVAGVAGLLGSDGMDPVWGDPASRVLLVGVLATLGLAALWLRDAREPWALRPGTARLLPSAGQRVR